jgi:ABC-type antimicrobial peptide transport system permease subunit
VLGEAMRLVLAGVAIGLPLALAATRLLKTQLHDVGTVDPISIGTAIGVLGASALVAVLVPAVRASRVAPVEALRVE